MDWKKNETQLYCTTYVPGCKPVVILQATVFEILTYHRDFDTFKYSRTPSPIFYFPFLIITSKARARLR
jgi:hypothetical protein